LQGCGLYPSPKIYRSRLPSCFKVLHSEVPYKIQRKDEVNVIWTYLGVLLWSLCRTVPSSFIFLLCLEKDGQVKMQRWELVAGNAGRY
jgi:hypothetical protein